MKKTAMFVLVLVFSLSLSLFLPTNTVISNENIIQVDSVDPIKIVAHRGASGYAPENTVAAFDKAIEMNADFIEVDVQRSKDGKLVIIHDPTVDRTTDGAGKVKDLTLKQLKRLDAGSWKGSQFKGEKIPTFEEIIKRYRKKTGILMDVKYPKRYPGIEKQIAEILKKHKLEQPKKGEIIIQSFNHKSMKKMKQLLPKVPIGVLITKKAHTKEKAIEEFASYADYYNPNYQILTKELVEKANAKGMKVFPWSVRSFDAIQFVLDMNTAAIITEYPEFVNRTKKATFLTVER